MLRAMGQADNEASEYVERGADFEVAGTSTPRQADIQMAPPSYLTCCLVARVVFARAFARGILLALFTKTRQILKTEYSIEK